MWLCVHMETARGNIHIHDILGHKKTCQKGSVLYLFPLEAYNGIHKSSTVEATVVYEGD